MEFNSSLHSDPSKRHSNKNYPKQNTKKKILGEGEREKERGGRRRREERREGESTCTQEHL